MQRYFSKHERQRELTKLIAARGFRSQQSVVGAMQELGFEVTQASISRDLQELGANKISGRYVLAPNISRFLDPSGFQTLVLKSEAAGPSLLVVQTEAGAASIVAASIDRLKVAGVVGTVAGDDTIFVATKNRAAQSRLIATLKQEAS